MKNIQVRVTDELYKAVEDIAKERKETTISDIVRDSLEVYIIELIYASEGRKLIWEDPRTGEKATVIVPSLQLSRLSHVVRKK